MRLEGIYLLLDFIGNYKVVVELVDIFQLLQFHEPELPMIVHLSLISVASAVIVLSHLSDLKDLGFFIVIR